MALAAVSERGREVAAPVQLRILRRVRNEGPAVQEKPLPKGEQEAPAVEKTQLVRLALPIARRKRTQVRPEIAQVRVGDERERWIRERRIVMRAVRATPFTHCAHEVRLGPATDARLGVRREVRPVESAKRRFQRAPAGIGHRLLTLLGVTAETATGLRQVFAALR